MHSDVIANAPHMTSAGPWKPEDPPNKTAKGGAPMIHQSRVHSFVNLHAFNKALECIISNLQHMLFSQFQHLHYINIMFDH